MKFIPLFLFMTILLTSCKTDEVRITEDFNCGWQFKLGDESDASQIDFDDSEWRTLNLPHDWSIEQGYKKSEEGTAASTGFVQGGIGWYRKSFKLQKKDEGKQISILFDGVYNNSRVWINGHLLGFRPYGFSSFSYDLSEYLKYDGSQNVIAVKVDRTTYADARWYTGSGINRKVQLIKKSPLHIAQWGVQITTPIIKKEMAKIVVKTVLENTDYSKIENVSLSYSIIDPNGVEVKSFKIDRKSDPIPQLDTLKIANPQLWSCDKPNLYTLKVGVLQNGKLVDQTTETFGIRSFKFDANTGFWLNGVSMKIKGVCLHGDAGAVGSAVPKAIWDYRIKKLKSIGCNAVRMSHNPHSIGLMEVCDEMGMLVMAESFDEWNVPKAKSRVYLGDNSATPKSSKSYSEYFNEWSERDLKDLIHRDFNHPCVIMWSIGNEIEWTYPYYSKTYSQVNGPNSASGYHREPIYDPQKIKVALEDNVKGKDSIEVIANRLADWVKEEDTTRPVTCGSVLPSISMVTGYGTAVDVLGFNYRDADYDIAHRTYPNLKIVGSENWGAYSEWKSCIDRDFVAGIFCWTGFAYLGEGGPWPRKGLDISFFDYAGFKTPRGHFFECLWKKDPKVYMVTTPAENSEFSYTEKNGWNFKMNMTAPPMWGPLRNWEWYKVFPKWNYNEDESIIVQCYTNCEQAELFLNGTSLGKQKLSDFADDNIIKWLVPYKKGELKVVGYNNDKKNSEYILNTQGKLDKIVLSSNKKQMNADGYDVTVVTAELFDDNGNLITDADKIIEFKIKGLVKNIGVDNGWEKNIQSHKMNSLKTHQGKAVLFIQSTKEKSIASVIAESENVKSNELEVEIK